MPGSQVISVTSHGSHMTPVSHAAHEPLDTSVMYDANVPPASNGVPPHSTSEQTKKPVGRERRKGKKPDCDPSKSVMVELDRYRRDAEQKLVMNQMAQEGQIFMECIKVLYIIIIAALANFLCVQGVVIFLLFYSSSLSASFSSPCIPPSISCVCSTGTPWRRSS